MRPYIYIVIGRLVFITTLNEFEFQIPVTIVELLPLKAFVEIWCFCQGSIEADVKNSMRNLNLLFLAEVCREIFFPPNFEDWLQLHLSHTACLAWD